VQPVALAIRAAALGAAAALTLAGCTSSAAHHPTGSGAPSSAPVAVPTGSGSPADPATVDAVKRAYGDFFSSTTTIARSQAVLQHGSAFHTVLVKEANSPDSDNVKIVVTAVRLLSPDTALVTYTLHAAGVALPGSHGYAVREDGSWKVAARTFCELLDIRGDAPAACKDSSITALPH
jgi:hypothetical protein